MIKLTAPNGDPVQVPPQDIVSMFPNTGAYHPSAETVLVVESLIHGLQKQAVQESIEEIENLIGA